MWNHSLDAAGRRGGREGIHWGMAFVGALVVLLLAGVLLNRLYDLQVRRYDEYHALAQNNYLKEESIQGYRGILKDRRGTILAENRPSMNAYAYPREVKDPEREIELLGEILVLSAEEKDNFADSIAKGIKGGSKSRFILRQDLSREEIALLEARHLDLPGIEVEPSTKRFYPLGQLAAHLIGYMKEVSQDDLNNREGYEPGDLIGKAGIERAYEETLRGAHGWRKEVRDHRGFAQSREVTEKYYQGETEKEPSPGNDVTLTLDAELERATEVAFRGYRAGAAVVVDIRTGRVLAMYSKPSYDLNEIADGMTSAEKRALDENPDQPWFNKSMEAYPPGSTFKVVTAIAALEAGVKPSSQVFCNGKFEIANHVFRCHSVHGYVNLQKALEESCDVYFYTRAVEMGLDPIAKYGLMLGLGESTGIGVGTDRAGILPDEEWYERNGRRYTVGMAVNASIGQGDVQTTPLQLAVLYAALANGGTVFTPQIVDRVESPDGTLLSSFGSKVKRVNEFSPRTLGLVQEGLVAVTKTGTLEQQAENYGAYRIAAKTGTAQVQRIGRGRGGMVGGYFGRHHAWVTAYAPYDNPQVAVVVFVAHGGSGAKAAGPIVMEIISRYFDIFGVQSAPEPESLPGDSLLPSNASGSLLRGVP
jgi:penicillin-binding protein 2